MKNKRKEAITMSNEWKIETLGFVANMYQPKTISQEEMIENGDYTVYGANGVIGRYDKYNHETPQLLVTCRGATCGTINISAPFSWITGNSMVIQSDSNVLDVDYLKYFLGQDKLMSQVITGAAQPQITRANLSLLKISFPKSLDRQREIAAVLDKASELVEKRKAQLAELDRLAESIFYDMFGDPVTNPKSWGVSTLKNLTTKIGSGATPKGGNENYKSDGISLIRSLNVHNSKFKYKDLAFIDELQAKALDGVTVEQDDVLLNITGASVARCCIVPNDILPARVNQHVAILRVKKDRLNFKFLCNVLISSEYQNKLLKDSKSNGATREALTKSNLEDLIIIIPPLDLQCQFSTIIEKIEEQKTKVKEALKESENLFQRLMQDMFNPKYHNS